MKNLEKIFMSVAFISALLSMVISIYTGTSWTWQMATIMWIFVAYIKERLIERYKNLIDRMTK
jgi:hypothetical protein